MFYMETTIVLEGYGPHHWKLPVTKADVDQKISLITDTSSFIPTKTESVYQSGVSKATLSPSSPRTRTGGSTFDSKLTSTADLTHSYRSSSTSLQPTFPPLVTPTSPPESPDRENTKVILGSILGGVLGFAIVAIAIFCMLNYFGDRHKAVGRRRKRRYCMFKHSPSRRGGITGSKSQYRHFPGELEENGGSAYDQNINPLDYVHIPVNSTMLPYEASPFYSDDLLQFKPIDPNNSFKQQQRNNPPLSPVNATIISEQILPARTGGTYVPPEIAKHPSLQTRPKPPGIALKRLSRQVSTSSSNYSPRSNQVSFPSSPLSPLPEHTIMELRGLNSSYNFQVLSKDPLGDSKMRSSLNMPKSPAYANASQRHQLLKTFKPQQGLECTPYDDGRGKYPEVQFGEALKMTDVEKPEIPPQASSERRNMALKRIKELSWSSSRLTDGSRKGSSSSAHGFSKHSVPSEPIRNFSNAPTNRLPSNVSDIAYTGISTRIANHIPSRILSRTPNGIPSHVSPISNPTSSRTFSGARNVIQGGFDNTPYRFPNRVPSHILGGAPSIFSSRASSGLQRGGASHTYSNSTSRNPIRIPSNSSSPTSKYGPTRAPSITSSPKNDELYDDYILFSNAYVSYDHKSEDTGYI